MTNIRIPKSLVAAPFLDPGNPRSLMALHEAGHFVVAVRLADRAHWMNRIFPSDIRISAKATTGCVPWALAGLPGAIFFGAGIVVAELYQGVTSEKMYHDKRQMLDDLRKVPLDSVIDYVTALKISSSHLAVDWLVVDAVASVIVELNGSLGHRRTGQLVELVRTTRPSNIKHRQCGYDAPPYYGLELKPKDNWPYGEVFRHVFFTTVEH